MNEDIKRKYGSILECLQPAAVNFSKQLIVALY